MISINNSAESSVIVISTLLLGLVVSFRKTQADGLLTASVSQELKGLSILAIVIAHITYMLVDNHKFLYPLASGAGVGVDMFLFLSGYGLSMSMLKKPLTAIEFYKRRLIKVFIPFWLVLIVYFIADAVLLDIHYPAIYKIQSFLGWFPYARPYDDVNSPFWYISWMLLFYLLFPLVFYKEKLWLTAMTLSAIANLITFFNPFNTDTNWFQQMHTDGFSVGVLWAWLFHKTNKLGHGLAQQLSQLKNTAGDVWHYLALTMLFGFAAYMTTHSKLSDWPKTSQLLQPISVVSPTHFIGQTCCILAMLAVVTAFSIKRYENRLLYLFGIYSYETYLVHWPLMLRYDIYFHSLPAWSAVLLWLLTFLAIGWLLQKSTLAIGTWVDKKC